MYIYFKLSILLYIYINSGNNVVSQDISIDNSIQRFPSLLFTSHNINKQRGPKWFIISGRKVIPGSILKIIVQTFKTGYSDQHTYGTMRALLQNNNTLVTSSEISCQPGEMSDILLRVPQNVVQGNWTINMVGKDEHGLTSFKETLQLIFTPKFLTILVQTSRPIYNAGQTVHFRIIMLSRDFQPYEKPVNVFVLDPRGIIMRRWPSRQPSIGVISLQFDLPEFPLLGNWKVNVEANSQEQTQDFIVEQYFMPRFEVYVNLPPVFTLSDNFVSGTVVANMTNGRHVYGNLTILLQMSQNNSFSESTEFENIHEVYIPNFNGVYDFFFAMERMSMSSTGQSNLHRKIIKIVAIVGDAFGWRINEGWAKAKLVQPQAKITFLGESSLFYAPGMPLTVHLMVSYDDSHPLDENDLFLSELHVTFSSSESKTETFNGTYLMENNGIIEATSWIPEDAITLEISAVFSNIHGLVDASSIQAIALHSPKNRFLHLETSTSIAELGSFIVLHVRNNFFVSIVNYVVISGGIIISSGQVPAVDVSYPSVTTFSLVASADMTPSANIVIWVIDNDGEVVASSLAIPINPLRRHEVDVGWNEHKDHSGRSVEVRMNGEIGAYFATYSVWEETFHMNSGHDLSEERILSQMMSFNEPNSKHLNGSVPHLRRASMRWRGRNRAMLKLFPTPMNGPDVFVTFALADAVISTDAKINLYPGRSNNPIEDSSHCSDYELKCLTGGCFLAEKRCDGEYDCYDSSDELACPFDINPEKEFKLNRISRHSSLYDDYGFNWAWQEIRGEAEQFLVYDVPKRPQTWVFNGFAVGKYFGLGLFQEHIQFESTRPFLLMLEAPKVVRMWEQVGLTVGVFNFHKSAVGAFLSVQQSEDYNVIAVEGNGIVESYNPRKLNGTFQHILWLPPESSIDVHVPIVFTRMGQIEVTVEGITQMQNDLDSIIIQVEPEGANIEQHTSILLDLKNRALVYEFMDIHLDESPIIPYSIRRRYVYGTAIGQVSVTGDVVGPLFPEIPINSDNMLGLDIVGAETSAYNFAANLWSLHYLRLTNQLTESKKIKVLAEINVDYVSLTRYQNSNGGFSNWIDCKESVWLTGHSVRSLAVANFQDWENYIFVDKKIIADAVEFLLQHQTGLGSFMETETYDTNLNPRIDPIFSEPLNGICQNVSLTAHTLLALQEALPYLDGKLNIRTVLAKQQAMKYLESRLPFISDVYNIAIVAWALTKCDSEETELAFSYLDKQKRTKGNLVYWSRDSIIVNPLVFEDSQRSYLQPKEDNEWDSMTIETTSYALLVYVKREGIGILQENVVRFLGSMRNVDGGFMSTVDSLVALEALVMYSYRARLRNVTNMSVEIEMSADPTNLINVQLTNNEEFAEMKVFELDNIWGHVNIVGRGSGQALVQLLYSYGVDVADELDVAVVPSFELDVTAKYFGRNSSHILITSCQKWINTGESQSSGSAVVEIHLPSGYYVVLSELLDIVNSGKVKNLRWARRTNVDVKFFFDRLTNEEVCFTYQIDRWYPVSNHSRYNLAQVYALYQPERFQMNLFEVFPLYALDICEVCGSFQCPYCPFYNAALSITIDFEYVLLNLFIYIGIYLFMNNGI